MHKKRRHERRWARRGAKRKGTLPPASIFMDSPPASALPFAQASGSLQGTDGKNSWVDT